MPKLKNNNENLKEEVPYDPPPKEDIFVKNRPIFFWGMLIFLILWLIFIIIGVNGNGWTLFKYIASVVKYGVPILLAKEKVPYGYAGSVIFIHLVNSKIIHNYELGDNEEMPKLNIAFDKAF